MNNDYLKLSFAMFVWSVSNLRSISYSLEKRNGKERDRNHFSCDRRANAHGNCAMRSVVKQKRRISF